MISINDIIFFHYMIAKFTDPIHGIKYVKILKKKKRGTPAHEGTRSIPQPGVAASGTRSPDGEYPPDTWRISLTSQMGSVNFAKHIIRENNCTF